MNDGELTFAKALEPEEPKHRTEVCDISSLGTIAVDQFRNPYGPSLKNAPRKASGKDRVLSGVAAVAKGDQVRWLVRSPH